MKKYNLITALAQLIKNPNKIIPVRTNTGFITIMIKRSAVVIHIDETNFIAVDKKSNMFVIKSITTDESYNISGDINLEYGLQYTFYGKPIKTIPKATMFERNVRFSKFIKSVKNNKYDSDKFITGFISKDHPDSLWFYRDGFWLYNFSNKTEKSININKAPKSLFYEIGNIVLINKNIKSLDKMNFDMLISRGMC